MSILLALIFALVAAFAIAFVAWPIWRGQEKGRAVLVASVAAFMLAIAAGLYLVLGQPELALRTLEGPKPTDRTALVSTLAERMRDSTDPRGWWLLGHNYLVLGDASDAAAAFEQALRYAPPDAKPEILADYGEALAVGAEGDMPPEAEAAFREALAHDAKNPKARFYIGLAFAERHDAGRALAIWESLLADTPPDAPWRQTLIDHIAMLHGAAPPDITAMVQGLADRLKRHADDPAGWQQLIRSYVVLKERDKARGALADARKALAQDSRALAALDAEAHELELDK